jgi:cytochrome c551/c552
MPATETTWRDQRLLHVVFAASGVVLLAATIWMFVEDHHREWKVYQGKARGAEVALTQWRTLQYETDDFAREFEEFQSQLATARAEPVDAALVEAFIAEVRADAARENAKEPDLSAVSTLAAKLAELAVPAAEKRAAAIAAGQDLDKARAAAEGAQALIAAARQQSPPPDEQKNKAILEKANADLADAVLAARAAESEARGAESAAAAARAGLMAELKKYVDAAHFREEKLLVEKKGVNSVYDKLKADEGLLVRDNAPHKAIVDAQELVRKKKEQLDAVVAQQEAAVKHRKDLDRIVGRMRARVAEFEKKIQEREGDVGRLEKARQDLEVTWFMDRFPYLGKRFLEVPILNAFNSPFKIDNFHYPHLPVDLNFKGVTRFDRCTTCHRAMDKPLHGDPTRPAIPREQTYEFVLATPPHRPAGPRDAEGREGKLTLRGVYGIELAAEGLIDPADVTVSYVVPESLASRVQVAGEGPGPAAMVGLIAGDVLERVNGARVYAPLDVERFLLGTVEWGTPLALTVRRGLPHPYSTHPRLDLFVGSQSPHALVDVGCTICHEGQGGATAFKWASHSPNDSREQIRWARQHGWFENHHWIYPMHPSRFIESSCLKCHHEVTDLEPSERFPDPPAAKVVAGHELVRRYGCFGCHEINGHAGADRRVGPDMRLEPNFYAVAQQLRATEDFARLDGQERGWVEELIRQPEADDVRRRLMRMLQEDEAAAEPRLAPEAHKMAAALKDVEIPGRMRKVGPSLRYVASKLDTTFLLDWIRDPAHFRPDTRMPRFFGHYEHLDPNSKAVAQKFEPIEVLAMTAYLLGRSQPFEHSAPPQGIGPSSREEKVARGRQVFQTRGCLACHDHEAFPDARAARGQEPHGPDLSGLAGKFSPQRNPAALRWLYSWVKDPTRYHVRTKMPVLFLDPIVQPDGTATDPAEDVAEFLVSGESSWEPASLTTATLDPSTARAVDEQGLAQLRLAAGTGAALDELALEYLEKAFFKADAAEYLKTGIPESMRGSLKGAEIELVGSASQTRKLLYVGSKSLAKHGCFGCHDIPGFEDAKPIGTGLGEWGYKNPSQLAFEHVVQYLHARQHGHGPADGSEPPAAAARVSGRHGPPGAAAGEAADDPIEPYYMHKIEEGSRIGFIYQKLREPRSFDYETTQNKPYNDRLRMPEFPFTAEEREAVITFVLGLVSKPPDSEYVYRPDPRNKAIVEGRQVLEKYNCGGCHVLERSKWKLVFRPEDLRVEGRQLPATFPFVLPEFTPKEIAASKEADRRGLLRGTVVVDRVVSDDRGLPLVLDEEGDPIDAADIESFDPGKLPGRFSHRVQLWEPTVLNGAVLPAGPQPLDIQGSLIDKTYPATGGFLADYLLPHVLAAERRENPNAKGREAWAWLPPPLAGQGKKVQPDWLHDFLLDPYPIRPAVVLRMPRFNMSSREARQLADYFAAVEGAEYPYPFNVRTRLSHVAAADAEFRRKLLELNKDANPQAGARFDYAMKIVTDAAGCVKCHQVADFVPKGRDRDKAPDLSIVYRRLRPDFVRDWVAYPPAILPYTTMPENIKYQADPAVPGGFAVPHYPGNAVEQLDALVDLLMNFDSYSRQRSSIAELVPPAPAEPAAATGRAGE